MEPLIEPTFIRRKATQRNVRWSQHALGELASEEITVQDVLVALQQGIVIETYPHRHRFLPDCLVLAFDPNKEPIHCVVAANEPEDYLLIVTIYRPSPEIWEDDWKTRK